jgi:ketosteroid isomerase-like protein
LGPTEDALERSIDRLESRVAIGELAAAYCSNVDGKDARGLAQLFTDDATFGELRGPDAIRDFFSRWMAEWGVSFHYPHAHTVDFVTADEATGLVTAHAEQRRGDQVWVMGLRYRDAYRRETGRWRFAGRAVEYVYRLPAEDYPTNFGEVRH